MLELDDYDLPTDAAWATALAKKKDAGSRYSPKTLSSPEKRRVWKSSAKNSKVESDMGKRQVTKSDETKKKSDGKGESARRRIKDSKKRDENKTRKVKSRQSHR